MTHDNATAPDEFVAFCLRAGGDDLADAVSALDSLALSDSELVALLREVGGVIAGLDAEFRTEAAALVAKAASWLDDVPPQRDPLE